MVEAYSPGWVQCGLSLPDEIDAADLRRRFEQAAANEEIFNAGFQKAPGMKTPILVPGAGAPAACARRTLRRTQTSTVSLRWSVRQDSIMSAVPCSGIVRETAGRPSLLILSASSSCADAATGWRCRIRTSPDAPARPAFPYVQFAAWQNQLLDDDDYTPNRTGRNQRPLIGLSIAFELHADIG